MEPHRSVDRKGGPGHTVLLALALAVPVTKVAYTVGGGDAARDVFVAMEPENWPNVLIGMVLTDPLLASVLAVVTSRVVFALFAARGAVPVAGGVLRALPEDRADHRQPGGGRGGGRVLLRSLVGAGHRAGRPRAAPGHRGGVPHRQTTASRTRCRAAHGFRTGPRRPWLPAGALATPCGGPRAMGGTRSDGRGAARPGLRLGAGRAGLDVGRPLPGHRGYADRGQPPDRAEPQGAGVVGWNLDTEEISNGAGCAGEESLYVREPWWHG